MDPDDRDSPQYRAEFRNAVYECLYAVAEENLSGISVVLVGPFTREIHEEGWKRNLKFRFEVEVVVSQMLFVTRLLEEGESRNGQTQGTLGSFSTGICMCRNRFIRRPSLIMNWSGLDSSYHPDKSLPCGFGQSSRQSNGLMLGKRDFMETQIRLFPKSREVRRSESRSIVRPRWKGRKFKFNSAEVFVN